MVAPNFMGAATLIPASTTNAATWITAQHSILSDGDSVEYPELALLGEVVSSPRSTEGWRHNRG